MYRDKYTSMDTLSIKDKAYLGALLHASVLKEEDIIDLSHGIPQELAPTKTYRENIVENILKKGTIVMFVSKEERYPAYQKLLYELHFKDIDKALEELMYPKYVQGSERTEALMLLREVQLYEAIEYMLLILQKFNLPKFRIEQRYHLLFLQILKTYSLGQLFNFIYTAIRNQAAYRQVNLGTYVPMGNYIYKKIKDRYEKATLEDWKIMNFDRVWGWQQSELSKLVCNRLLNLDESAFHEVTS